MTWGDLTRKARSMLEGVEDGETDAVWIICEAAGLGRAELALMSREPCAEDAAQNALKMAARRGAGEPLQYVLGWVPFCGLRIACDRRALIPRPETEEMAARIVEELRPAAEGEPPRCLDLGTGSGALSLALAHAGCAVDAVDVSPEALELARENAVRLGLSPRIRFFCGAWFRPLPDGSVYDAIVSNPPYISEGEIAGLAAEVARWEPHTALSGGVDGLNAYREIIPSAAKYLKPEGKLWLEVGVGQAEAVCALARSAGLSAESMKDMRGMERVVRAAHHEGLRKESHV